MICSPVAPLYSISLPVWENPNFIRAERSSGSFSPKNAVASMNLPSREPTLPPIISRTWPTVIREGMAWGFSKRSGTTPDSVNGISSWGTIRPTTPFWPWREANLSPNSGIRWSRLLTLARRLPLEDSVRMTISTTPFSLERMVTEVSLLCWGVRPNSEGSSRNRGGLVLPIRTSLGPT